jgi:hypothetical protein
MDCDLDAMRRAIVRWNSALGKAGARVRVVLAGRTSRYGLRQNGISTVSLLARGWPRDRRLFGWTSIWLRHGTITEGDIAFNVGNHAFRCDIPRRLGPAASLEQEMLHEVGHLLGLNHAPAGLMQAAGYGTTLDPDALEGIRVLYGR